MQALTDLLTLDTSRLIFDPAIKVFKPKYSYHKIPIRIRHNNGEGPLYVMLKNVLSYGVHSFQAKGLRPLETPSWGSRGRSLPNGKKAHTISIKLWDTPTEEQGLWRRKFEELIQTCINYVMENKNKLGISVRRSEMEGPKGGASPLKYKVVDDGEEQVRVVDSAPRIYPKVRSYRLKDQ